MYKTKMICEKSSRIL